MFLKKYILVAIASVALLTLTAHSSHAALTLADLTNPDGSSNGQTVVVGDKTFSDFTYSATGDMPSASGVNVIPLTSGDLGLRFTGAFHDNAGGGASDAAITFTVTTSGGFHITDAHLSGNPSVIGTTDP